MKIHTNLMMKSLLVGLTIACSSLPSGAAPEASDQHPMVNNIGDLKAIDARLVAMADKCAAATVALVSPGGMGTGSGVIVSKDGLILTAGHVLAALSDEIIVIFPDGSRKQAKPLGADFDRDAAMVKITDEGTYPCVEPGDSKNLLRNDWCVALGHPGGFDPLRTPPLRIGRILRMDQFILSDCAVIGGDSGGPLFDLDGKVIGIHSNIGATLSENRHVPVAVYQDQWDSLVSGKRSGEKFAKAPQRNPFPGRPSLGVHLAATDGSDGVQVTGVHPNSPASRAGIKQGDIILSVNGRPTNSPEELLASVRSARINAMIDISLMRGTETISTQVKLARAANRNRAEKPAEKPASGNDAIGTKALDEFINQLLKSESPPELTPEKIKELGGPEIFRKRLMEITRAMDPKELSDLMRRQFQQVPDEFFMSSMNALRPVTGKSADSIVTLLADGKPVALGTVVSKDGRVLTKDTETRNGTITVRHGGHSLPAKLLERFPKYDLALYQTEASGLHPVSWADHPGKLGSLLTTSGIDGEPLGIGLVSVLARPFADVGFLGVQSAVAENGVLVEQAVKDGPAAKAGLKKGDVILSINGKAAKEPQEFGQTIRTFKAGDVVNLKVRGEDGVRMTRVKLGTREIGRASGQLQKMNEMSGPLSQRVSGFPSALQHDIPLLPNQCGSPLLDLEGRCIGINVSRAGRVNTLAIPASDVRKLLAPHKKARHKNAAAKSPGASPDEREEIRKAVRDVRKALEELEKRLEMTEQR